MSGLRDIAITLVLALCIFFAVQFTVQSCQVDGSSMEPSFHDGQRVLVVKAAYWFGEPQRGDVVIFPSNSNPNENLIKRVIGLPGETIEIEDNHVYIDGDPLQEPYIADLPDSTYHSTEIPQGQYFVMGDNRNHSNDSRSWGPVPGGQIAGKAWLIYWPFSDWQLVPNYTYALE
ncbi:MAG: signal peptidase I [Chloroflexota bacterium]